MRPLPLPRAVLVATGKLAPPRRTAPARAGFAALLGELARPSVAAKTPIPRRPAASPGGGETASARTPDEDEPRRPARREEAAGDPPSAGDDALFDPASRAVAQLAPIAFAAPPPTVDVAPRPVPIDPALAAAYVEAAAFWGDGARGLARLRFGSRARSGLSGATVTLEHDGERVALRIDGADGETTERLRARLEARGVAVDEA